MSAYLLYNPGVPSSIADELESFLHVMVYGAFRRMRSTLYTIKGFNDEYFAGCRLDDVRNRITCPNAKCASVMTLGVLTSGNNPVKFFSPRGDIQEKHPLNDLIADLLRMFHSRYVVEAWEKRSRPYPMTPERPKQLQTIPECDEDLAAEFQSDLVGLERKPVVVQTGTSQAEPQEPTAKMYEDVKALSNHVAVREIFYSYVLSKAKWPLHDVIDDRMVVDIVDPPSQPQPSGPLAPAPSAHRVPSSAALSNPSPPASVPCPPAAVVPAPPASSTLHPLPPPPQEPDAHDVPKPAKRARREPTWQAAAGSSTQTGRVTRSRSAANIAAVATAIPPVPPNAQRMAPVASLETAAPRVTRSQSRAMATGNGTTAASTGGVSTRSRDARANTSRRLTRNATGASRTRSNSNRQSREQGGGGGQRAATKSVSARRGRRT